LGVKGGVSAKDRQGGTKNYSRETRRKEKKSEGHPTGGYVFAKTQKPHQEIQQEKKEAREGKNDDACRGRGVAVESF